MFQVLSAVLGCGLHLTGSEQRGWHRGCGAGAAIKRSLLVCGGVVRTAVWGALQF